MTLLSKKNLHDKKVEPDQVGFDISNEFVVGFGLDYNEKYRNFPYIGIFNTKYLKNS
jgi:hypoxanthine phosphoribosyltransferase